MCMCIHVAIHILFSTHSTVCTITYDVFGNKFSNNRKSCICNCICTRKDSGLDVNHGNVFFFV